MSLRVVPPPPPPPSDDALEFIHQMQVTASGLRRTEIAQAVMAALYVGTAHRERTLAPALLADIAVAAADALIARLDGQ
jgi:hypothetical protein